MNFPANELQALQTLFYATSGVDWTWNDHGKRWNFGNLNDDNPCNWEGISCTCLNTTDRQYHPFDRDYVSYYYYYYDDSVSYVSYNLSSNSSPIDSFNYTCRVEKIYLIDHNMRGTLPPIFGSFTNLTHLHLARNYLSGTIPYQLMSQLLPNGLPNRLMLLDLCDNSIEGSISSSIVYLSHLEMLALSFNKIIGSLPENLGLLTSIKVIYLNENSITGTIPSSIGSLSNLKIINLISNSIIGQLPTAVGYIGNQLTHLLVHTNSLSKTIPTSLALLTNLQILYLSLNKFTSTIPAVLGSLINLEIFHCSFNELVGTIPQSFSQLTKLVLVGFRDNKLTGTVPDFLFTFNLTYLALSSNYFIPSTLPSGLSALTRLEVLHYANMGLYGTIPTFLSTFHNLEFLYFDQSRLTGTLPSFLGSFSRMNYISFHQNKFIGSIPSSFGKLANLTILSLYENNLTGTLPTELAQLTSLVTLLLGNNSLSGSVTSTIFASSLQKSLQTIDISNNRFRGDIPSAVFELPSLQVFAAGLNCFNKSPLPSQVCGAMNLTELILDGVSVSRSCRSPPIISTSLDTLLVGLNSANNDSYESTGGISGGIPTCLLGLPKLQVLHMSGNDIDGTIPSVHISPVLVDLSLSHNVLSGTIPLSVQDDRQWTSLDLSFNKLGGTISPKLTISSKGSLYLSVNRLSGPIPASLNQLKTISILAGNFFACSSKLISQSEEVLTLPVNDQERETYQCGSDALLTSIVIFASFFGFLATVAVVAFLIGRLKKKRVCLNSMHHRISETLENLTSWLQVFSVDSPELITPYSDHLIHFGIFNRTLRWNILIAAIAAIIILLPIYVCLTTFSSPYTYSYAWIASLTLVTGTSSSISIGSFFLLAAIIGCMYFIFLDRTAANIIAFPTNWIKYLNHKVPMVLITFNDISFQQQRVVSAPSRQQWNATVESSHLRRGSDNRNSHLTFYGRFAPTYGSLLHYTKLIVIGVVNLIVVVSVNSGFVQAALTAKPIALLFYSFLLSIFKVIWTGYIVPWFTSLTYRKKNKSGQAILESDIRDAFTQAVVACFNVIIIPCLAIAIVSPSCFRYLFYEPPVVTSSYDIAYCNHFSADKHPNTQTIVRCYQETILEDFITFYPPFQYSYQCSAAVMIGYTSVYVYFFLVTSIVMPITWIFILWLIDRCQMGGRIRNTLLFLIPRRIRSIDDLLSNPHDLVDVIRESFRSTVMHRQSISNQRNSNIQKSNINPIRDDNDNKEIGGDDDHHHTVNASAVESGGHHAMRSSFGIQPSIEAFQISTAADIIDKAQIKPIFNRRSYVVTIVQSVAIIATFGLIFPPLAVLGAISIFSYTLTNQLVIGRLYLTAKELQLRDYTDRISEDCNGINRIMKQSIWLVYPMMAVFYSLFLFDIAGDTNNISTAIEQGPPIAILFVPAVIYAFDYCSRSFSSLSQMWCRISPAAVIAAAFQWRSKPTAAMSSNE